MMMESDRLFDGYTVYVLGCFSTSFALGATTGRVLLSIVIASLVEVACAIGASTSPGWAIVCAALAAPLGAALRVPIGDVDRLSGAVTTFGLACTYALARLAVCFGTTGAALTMAEGDNRPIVGAAIALVARAASAAIAYGFSALEPHQILERACLADLHGALAAYVLCVLAQMTLHVSSHLMLLACCCTVYVAAAFLSRGLPPVVTISMCALGVAVAVPVCILTMPVEV